MITVVMMAGLPGAGKSTLAHALKQEYQWRLIDKDGYRVKLIECGMENDQAASEAYDLSFEELHTALINQQSVILDTVGLYPFILEEVKRTTTRIGYVRLKVILCVIERHQRLLRLHKRTTESPSLYTRNHHDPITIADYLELFKKLPHDTLHLYTHLHSPQECFEQAKSYINS